MHMYMFIYITAVKNFLDYVKIDDIFLVYHTYTYLQVSFTVTLHFFR